MGGDLLAPEADDFAGDEDGGGGHFDQAGGDMGEGGFDDMFAGGAAVFDKGDGLMGVATGGDEFGGDGGAGFDAHEDDEGIAMDVMGPADAAFLAGVAGDDGEGSGEVAVSDGDTGVAGDGDGGADAGDDFAGDAMGEEEFGFFSAAAEDEGVAGFEADDLLASAGEVDEEAEDFGLDWFLLPGTFAGVDEFGGGVSEGEYFGADEPIVKHDVGCGEPEKGANRE